MKINQLGLVLVLILTVTAVATAEEGPPKLPADGWWVRYYVIAKSEGMNKEWTITRTYSLVGTAIEDNRKCRWVEMKSKLTFRGKEQADLIKFLVPEKELLESDKPLDSLVRAWRKIDDGAVKEQKFNQPLTDVGSVFSADYAFGRDMRLFPGPQRKTKPVAENRIVDYQQGRLEVSEGRTGKYVATRQALSVVQKQAIAEDFTIWNHPTVSLGFVAAKTRVELHLDDVLRPPSTEEWVIEDFGADAKSAMPENN